MDPYRPAHVPEGLTYWRGQQARLCGTVLRLHKTQHSVPPASKETVVNLSSNPLDDAVYSALWKGLNYAVAPTVFSIKDILTGVEKAIKSLPAETAEEARQEIVRIIRDSSTNRHHRSARKHEVAKFQTSFWFRFCSSEL